jgi:hypothetical protein
MVVVTFNICAQTVSLIPFLVNSKIEPCCPIVSTSDSNQAALDLLLTIFRELLRAVHTQENGFRDFLKQAFRPIAFLK